MVEKKFSLSSVDSKFNFNIYLQPGQCETPKTPVTVKHNPATKVVSKEELIKNYKQRKYEEFWCQVYQVKSY